MKIADVGEEPRTLMDLEFDFSECFGDELEKSSLSLLLDSVQTNTEDAAISELVKSPLTCPCHVPSDTTDFRSQILHQTKVMRRGPQHLCGIKFAFIS